jgi:tetratricopeptide (TPR) repeat protein
MSRRKLALALLPLIAIACSSYDTHAVGEAYYAGRTEEATQRIAELLEKDADGRALYLNERGVLSLDAGRLDDAYRDFNEANQIMEAFEGANLQEVGAIMGSEASKIWRGEPYEKSMNAYYLGILGLLRGIDDNARAGFKNAIFLDSSNAGEKYQCDFAPAYFLEGFASERLGDTTVAQEDLGKAHELVPDSPVYHPETSGNFVVVVDVGRGPTKVATGAHGEAIRFVEHFERPANVFVVADGKTIGAAEHAGGDLYFQATTRGGRVFDSILRGKAIYKSAARGAGITTLVLANELPEKNQTGALIIGAALLISSFLVNSEADTRHWTTLPGEVQLFRGKLAPGTHAIQIVPSSGRLAAQSAQTIEVPANGDVVIYARVLP